MTRDTPGTTQYDRRTVLKAGFAAASAAAVGATPAAASGTAEASLEDWLGNVSNFDGIVDERGNSEVTVTVGAEGNNGAFAFGPPVVRVDPGTTVVWEWNGKGGSHNVLADDGSYGSEMLGDEGDTFEQSFDAEGVSKYYCDPHKTMGMKGAVVVGDGDVAVPSTDGSGSESGADGGAESAEDVDYDGWFEGVSNFDDTVDRTGESEVTIEVGANANEGGLAFGPAAVHVDPGTTVAWEWTGAGGSHNVVAKDGSYESEMQGNEGDTFERTFDAEGVSKYYCDPHKTMGMKGAVVVGSPTAGESAGGAGGSDGGGEDAWLYGLVGAFVTALLSPLLFFGLRNEKDGGPEGAGRSHGPGQR